MIKRVKLYVNDSKEKAKAVSKKVELALINNNYRRDLT